VPTEIDEAGGTMIGAQAAFDTQVVPAIMDVEIITLDGVKRRGKIEILKSGEIQARRGGVLRKIGMPLGTGMLIAACVVLALAIAIKSAGATKRATAAPAESAPPAAQK
jgi:hypothetical protein